MSKRNVQYYLVDGLQTNREMIQEVWKTFTHLDAGYSQNVVTNKVDKSEFKTGWSILFSSVVIICCATAYIILSILLGIEKLFKMLHVAVQYTLSAISVFVNLVFLSPVILFVMAAFRPESGRRRKYTDFFIKKD